MKVMMLEYPRFPFYYEGKILFLLWMISSATRGGTIMYRKYIHPTLVKHEAVSKAMQGYFLNFDNVLKIGSLQEIDACLADLHAKASGTLMGWGYRFARSVFDAAATVYE